MPHVIAGTTEPLITANTSTTGASDELARVYSAPSAEEQFIEALDFQSHGTNAATVARVFLNNGRDRTVAANNVLWKQYTLAATTASQTAAPASERKEIKEYIPAGSQILVAIGTGATDGWGINVVAGPHYAARDLVA
jgi:hypothetical protein